MLPFSLSDIMNGLYKSVFSFHAGYSVKTSTADEKNEKNGYILTIRAYIHAAKFRMRIRTDLSRRSVAKIFQNLKWKELRQL
jgi:hypothetical protein